MRAAVLYGKDDLDEKDNDVACATEAIQPGSRLELPGGQHYDEDSAALARRIDQEFARRAEPMPQR